MKIRMNRYKRYVLEELLKGPLPSYMVRTLGHYERLFNLLVGARLIEFKLNSWDVPCYYVTSLGRKALRCTGTDVEFDTVNPNCPPSMGVDRVKPEPIPKVIPVRVPVPEPVKPKFSGYVGTQGSTVAFHKLFPKDE